MYAKLLFNRKVLYFKYAPPFTDLDGASNDRPKLPYVGAPPEKGSVFYYWWAFLREHEGYRSCCERGGTGEYSKLYEDFGDVRGEEFFTWWKNGGRLLFCEPELDEPSVVMSSSEEIDHEREVLIKIPITGDLERTLAGIRRVLKPAMDKKRKRDTVLRPNAQQSNAKYRVYTNPVIATLYATLTVHKARKIVGNNATQQQLRVKVVEMMTADARSKRINEDFSSSKLSRYEKSARHLIANVGRGVFPNSDDPATGEPLIRRKGAVSKKPCTH